MCKKSTIRQVRYTKIICWHCGCEETVIGNRAPKYCRNCAIEEKHYYRRRETIVTERWHAARLAS